MFGRVPANALFARRVAGLDVHDDDSTFDARELRPAERPAHVVGADLNRGAAEGVTMTRTLLPVVRLDRVEKASY